MRPSVGCINVLRKGTAKKDIINRGQEGPRNSLYEECKEIGPKDLILPAGLGEKQRFYQN